VPVNNTEPDKHLRPSDPDYPYELIVDSNTDSDTYPNTGFDQRPDGNWACLVRHYPDEPVSDANPYPEEYIQNIPLVTADNLPPEDSQEQTITIDGTTKGVSPCYPHICRHHVPQGRFQGWKNDHHVLLDFIEAVRDNYYEVGMNRESLSVFVDISRTNDGANDQPWFTLYWRDPEGGEYLCLNYEDLYGPGSSTAIMKGIVLFAEAYEEPTTFKQKHANRRTQTETS
jgi:hypothetical protein